jgi:hypothetical protein
MTAARDEETGLETGAKPTVDNPQALTFDVFHKNTTDESVAAPVPEGAFPCG